MLQCIAAYCSVWQYVAVCCSVWQYVAVCCSVLQCAAVCCSVLQCVAVCLGQMIVSEMHKSLYTTLIDCVQKWISVYEASERDLQTIKRDQQDNQKRPTETVYRNG